MAKINDKGVYSLKSPISAGDYVVGTDSTSNSPDNQTKNFLMSDVKTFVNSGSGVVTSVTSTNPAITVAGTTTPALTSTQYAGGATIGHVPPGGDAVTYLKGDGSWGTPLVTSTILYAIGESQDIASATPETAEITFSDASNGDVTIESNGNITFDTSGLYIVEFFGNFNLSTASLSEVMFQPFLGITPKYNSSFISLPATPDIFRPFTRTDVFQVEASQVLTYKAGHTSGVYAQLRAPGHTLGNITASPATSVTVSKIKI